MSWNRYPGSRLERQHSESGEDVDSQPVFEAVVDSQAPDLPEPAANPLLPLLSSVFNLDGFNNTEAESTVDIEPKPERYNGELGTPKIVSFRR